MRASAWTTSSSAATLRPMKLFDDPAQEKLVWHLREEGLGATAKVPDMPENHEGWEDSSVPPDKLGGYLRDLKKLMDKYDYVGPLYGHFGQGCVHTRLTFDLRTADGIQKWRRFLEEAVGPGGQLRRLALRRTRRRPGARRAACAHVQPGDHRRVSRVQGDLGSRTGR